MDRTGSVLLVARPGRLRDGWRALLLAAPQIGSVAVADDVPAAMAMTGGDRPELVVVEAASLSCAAWALLDQVRSEEPGIRLLVLAADDQEGAAAWAAGADAVLTIGFPAAALFAVVGRMSEAMRARG